MEDTKDKKSSFGLSERNQYLVAGGLCVVLAGLLLFRFTGNSEAAPVPEAAQPANQQSQQIVLPPPPKPLPVEPKLATTDEAPPRDPFAVPDKLRKMLDEKAAEEKVKEVEKNADLAARAQALLLKGIMGSEGNRTAFINNRPARIGDKIADFEVVKIEERSVTLQIGKSRIELKLKSPTDNPQWEYKERSTSDAHRGAAQ